MLTSMPAVGDVGQGGEDAHPHRLVLQFGHDLAAAGTRGR
jgi:hypothetical protein